jgi:histidinol dehydrogenase
LIRLETEEPRDLLEGRWPNREATTVELNAYVASILEDVRKRGDDAVLEYTERFDDVSLSRGDLLVKAGEVEEAYEDVSGEQVEALRTAKERLEYVESRRLERLVFETKANGVDILHSVRPISNVGCYVPGGKAAYPSTLVMNVVPAKVAGVPHVVVCTPPGKDGEVAPLTLVAADVCGVDTIYRVGGVQAIAALAYGTETIEPVVKIVGPGNKYITAAKNVVSRDVAVDKPAGPTEIIIIADESADPKIVALDMISQAEHGEGGISGLVTTSRRFAADIAEALEKNIKSSPRSEVISDVLSKGGFIYVCPGRDEAIDFVNRFAPEHLELHVGEPMEIADRITSAGLILIGPYTPVSATDYCMGVNHVLPTGGYGKIHSALSVMDYLKTVDIIRSSREGLRMVKDGIKALAEAEGLPNHGLAVDGRFTE